MKIFSNPFIPICILWLLSSCVDPIEVNTERADRTLVVSGYVTAGPGPHKVRISRTSEKIQISEPESGALVFLVDEDGNREIWNEVEPGTYIHEGELIRPEPGRAYHLDIILANGVRYGTRPDRMPVLVGRDSVWYDMGESFSFPVVNVNAQSQLPESEHPLFIRWVVEEVYLFTPTDFPDPFGSVPPPCYVTAWVDPQKINLYDGSRFNTTFIEKQKLAIRTFDDTFRERHFFNIYQQSLSEAAFRFWERVDIVTNQSGSIFDIPPAPVAGNAFREDGDETVLGFFAAINQDTARFDTYGGFFEFRTSDPCLYSPFKRSWEYPDECLNCLILPGASYEKPPYFY